MKLLLTTNPGIEDIVVEEARTLFPITSYEIRERRGRVVVTVDLDTLDEVGWRTYLLRSIHSAYILLSVEKTCSKKECLDVIRDSVRSSNIENYITPNHSFAVRSERAGSHEYTSIDVARVVGEEIIKSVEKTYGKRPPVSLKNPSIVVKADVVFDMFYLGIELTGDASRHRRGYRIYDHPASLKPTIAYAMLRISGAKDGEIILDPMCGGGTIPIEAAFLFENTVPICLDRSRKHIKGAKLNAEAARVRRIRFIVGDATRVHEYIDTSVDKVVTNPPYGLRLGNPAQIHGLYKQFLLSVRKILSEHAILTMITPEYRFVEKISGETGFEIVSSRFVAHGDLWTKILNLAPL